MEARKATSCSQLKEGARSTYLHQVSRIGGVPHEWTMARRDRYFIFFRAVIRQLVLPVSASQPPATWSMKRNSPRDWHGLHGTWREQKTIRKNRMAMAAV
tara:strand:- start:8924 stop:9223 length:300 start_codon:yes stop_codon:yes gene_type:complete